MKDKELEYINKKLIYDFIDDNKFDLFIYVLIILVTFPLTTVYVSKLFGALTESVSKYDFSSHSPSGKNTSIHNEIQNKTLLGQVYFLMFVLFAISFISWTQNEVEKIIFPKYITFLNYTLRTGTLNSRNENFEEVNIGETLTRIQDTVYDLEMLLKEISNKIIPFFLKLIVVNIYYYISIHKRLGTISTIIDVFRMYLIYFMTTEYRNCVYKKFTEYYNSNKHFSDTFENIFHIQINSQVENEIEKQKLYTEKLSDAIKNQMQSRRHLIMMMSLINITCFLLKFRVMNNLFTTKKIEKKDMITFIFIEFQYLFDYKDFGYVTLNIFNIYEGIRNSSNQLYKLLIETDIRPNPRVNITNGEIIMDNVSYCFDSTSNKCLFENISFIFEYKKKYILEGASGSGKSSLIHLLLKLIPVTYGSLTIGGFNIEDIPTAQIREIITLIPQRNTLFSGLSVLDNLLYGTNATREDLNILFNKYPKLKAILFDNTGEEEFLSRIYDGTNVSGGQKRIIINTRGTLRTLALKSFIVIIDEPIVGLNEEAATETLTMINKEFIDQTVILIEHELQKNTFYKNRYLSSFIPVKISDMGIKI